MLIYTILNDFTNLSEDLLLSLNFFYTLHSGTKRMNSKTGIRIFAVASQVMNFGNENY